MSTDPDHEALDRLRELLHRLEDAAETAQLLAQEASQILAEVLDAKQGRPSAERNGTAGAVYTTERDEM